uniref:Uncharacterized protein n=1 Tax=Aegilops tauschii subsp. strangulata TaxID=200361 RepID=A0A453IUD3_AEGTS
FLCSSFFYSDCATSMVSTLKSQDYIVTDLQGSIMFREEDKTNEFTKQDLQVQWID